MYHPYMVCSWGYDFLHLGSTLFIVLLFFYLYITGNNNYEETIQEDVCIRKCLPPPRVVTVCTKSQGCCTEECFPIGRECVQIERKCCPTERKCCPVDKKCCSTESQCCPIEREYVYCRFCGCDHLKIENTIHCDDAGSERSVSSSSSSLLSENDEYYRGVKSVAFIDKNIDRHRPENSKLSSRRPTGGSELLQYLPSESLVSQQEILNRNSRSAHCLESWHGSCGRPGSRRGDRQDELSTIEEDDHFEPVVDGSSIQRRRTPSPSYSKDSSVSSTSSVHKGSHRSSLREEDRYPAEYVDHFSNIQSHPISTQSHSISKSHPTSSYSSKKTSSRMACTKSCASSHHDRCMMESEDQSCQTSKSQHECLGHSHEDYDDDSCRKQSVCGSKSAIYHVKECPLYVDSVKSQCGSCIPKSCVSTSCCSRKTPSKKSCNKLCEPSVQDIILVESKDQSCQASISLVDNVCKAIKEDPCNKVQTCGASKSVISVTECPICRNICQPQSCSNKFSYSEVKLQFGAIVPEVRKKCCVRKPRNVCTEAYTLYTDVVRPYSDYGGSASM